MSSKNKNHKVSRTKFMSSDPFGRATIPTSLGQTQTSPDELYGKLFKDVQMKRIFPDSKTFADSIPLCDPVLIIERYFHLMHRSDFDLERFVRDNFDIPEEIKITYKPDPGQTIDEHIEELWTILTRQPQDQQRGGSLLALPKRYVVPGGRFREIYYWDTYFTMLGLVESNHSDLIHDMVDNFAYLIDRFGHIPNGNRNYYLSRSQPPYFSLMVKLFSEVEGKEVLSYYLPQLQREYDYWMSGSDCKGEPFTGKRRVVFLPEGLCLNRYWDDKATPRPEAYYEDIELAEEAHHQYHADESDLYRHIRAAAESGWDFSSRWLREGDNFASIHTTDIIPVDLNCLMYYLECLLSEAYQVAGQHEMHLRFSHKAKLRAVAIQKYFWDPTRNFFMDYDFRTKKSTECFSLAGTYPLFFKLATNRQAHYVDTYLRLNFMRSGGLLTTLTKSGQQWDAPNGWSPMQWTAYKGLRNYNLNRTADRLRDNWLCLNEKTFKQSRKMLEKYNVADTNLEAQSGEYKLQEGFGWTNGVYLQMKLSQKTRPVPSLIY
ncbi:alpha,alpha-trehalase TreA [Telluribacter sp. SYSU D00476]|uniref:alpha,alpha-trehalase TreA n=1 Tax=Telluribacter sp. SYSU D00476 TaxID=2811430 RepID=UPI001FF6D8DD|nr:alpha,alpha-trehalase TreA [Telluribacter sp. SYSU D00476]